jgi:hypothetical protein
MLERALYAYNSVLDGLINVLRCALDAGVSPSVLTGPRNDISLLRVAVQSGHASVVKLLLEAGADAKLRDPYGKTPLHVAVTSKHPECVRKI